MAYGLGGGGGGGNTSSAIDEDFKKYLLGYYDDVEALDKTMPKSGTTPEILATQSNILGNANKLDTIGTKLGGVLDQNISDATNTNLVDINMMEAPAMQEYNKRLGLSNQSYNMAGGALGAGGARQAVDQAGLAADLAAKLAQNRTELAKWNVHARQVATQNTGNLYGTTAGALTAGDDIRMGIYQDQRNAPINRAMQFKNLYSAAVPGAIHTTGGGGCVIATHAVASGVFTPDTKANAVEWCTKTLHNKWWGETMRRGYRYLGRRRLKAGTVSKQNFEDFKACLEWANGKRPFNLRIATIFCYRAIQTFVVGLFIREKNDV